MLDAVCFVYVTKATGTLSEVDLELIRSLYQHHKASEKRIIWVVTAIDLADDLGLDDEPNWKATVSQNNSYLETFFPGDDGGPDLNFIGQGFLGVSPALEAQAAYLRSTDPHGAAELQAECRMDDLRRLLVQIIELETGPKYAKKAATEARLILQRHRMALLGTLAMERVPVDRIREETLQLQGYVQVLDAEASGLRLRLEEELRTHIKAALRSFDEAGLTAYLHQELDELIRSADLRRADVINQLEIRKTQIVRDWLSSHGLRSRGRKSPAPLHAMSCSGSEDGLPMPACRASNTTAKPSTWTC